MQAHHNIIYYSYYIYIHILLLYIYIYMYITRIKRMSVVQTVLCMLCADTTLSLATLVYTVGAAAG